uniref:Uncharacterized protein n=1 Tax=Solanum lycopersicum TaxID=4081 RepID=A0A3Q7ISD8_SOLLC
MRFDNIAVKLNGNSQTHLISISSQELHWPLGCLDLCNAHTKISSVDLVLNLTLDLGGILWFQNLTEVPSGVLGPVFPLLIAGLHYINVQNREGWPGEITVCFQRMRWIKVLKCDVKCEAKEKESPIKGAGNEEEK